MYFLNSRFWKCQKLCMQIIVSNATKLSSICTLQIFLMGLSQQKLNMYLLKKIPCYIILPFLFLSLKEGLQLTSYSPLKKQKGVLYNEHKLIVLLPYVIKQQPSWLVLLRPTLDRDYPKIIYLTTFLHIFRWRTGDSNPQCCQLCHLV